METTLMLPRKKSRSPERASGEVDRLAQNGHPIFSTEYLWPPWHLPRELLRVKSQD